MNMIRSLAAALIFCLTSVPVVAHAILLSCVPTVNSIVKGPDTPIRLRFNSRIDLKRSKLLLVYPDGTQRELTISSQDSPDMLVSEAKGLSQGLYLIHWQVLASDGHITRGEIGFKVQ